MEGNFQACLKHVLAMEGGFTNDPSDHGGATNWGITAATLAHWRGHQVTAADVGAIQPEEARAIYHANYWNTVRGGELPGGVDLVVFDISVNSGPGRAVRVLQEVVGVAADGLLGPVTLRAVAALPAAEIVDRLDASRSGDDAWQADEVVGCEDVNSARYPASSEQYVHGDTATVSGVASRLGGMVLLGGSGGGVFTAAGGGADRLTGGKGADIFVYKAARDSPLSLSGGTIDIASADSGAAFTAGTDELDLTAFGFTGGAFTASSIKCRGCLQATAAKQFHHLRQACPHCCAAIHGRGITVRRGGLK